MENKLKVLDFENQKVDVELPIQWPIGHVLFTSNCRKIILQSKDRQYIFVYSLIRLFQREEPI